MEASRYFRHKYDNLLDQWNAVRAKYGYEPAQLMKEHGYPLPKRKT